MSTYTVQFIRVLYVGFEALFLGQRSKFIVTRVTDVMVTRLAKVEI
jgi:hypothetical protein